MWFVMLLFVVSFLKGVHISVYPMYLVILLAGQNYCRMVYVFYVDHL